MYQLSYDKQLIIRYWNQVKRIYPVYPYHSSSQSQYATINIHFTLMSFPSALPDCFLQTAWIYFPLSLCFSLLFFSPLKAWPLLTFLQELKGEAAYHFSLFSPSCGYNIFCNTFSKLRLLRMNLTVNLLNLIEFVCTLYNKK